MKTYEAMFLLDAENPDFDQAAEPVRTLLGRIQAEVLTLKPWDDRRLAYDIKGRRRGLYVLTYFKADPARVPEIQHEVQISEKILRLLLLSGDDLTPAQINAETPATLAQARGERRREEREEHPQAPAAPGAPAESGPIAEAPAPAPKEKTD